MLILGALALALAGTLPEVDKPLKTGARNSEDAAVVIGIEDYIFVADVPYATRDAQAVYDFLIYTRGVPSSQVRLLNGGASRELILEAVTKAGKQVSQNGVVWVYFAGHGAADPSTGDRILLGDDVRNDPVAFASRALTVDELLSFGGAGGGRVHLLVDACYSGLGRSGEAVLAGKRFAVPNYAVQGSRHLLWSASSGDQLSGPLEAVQHGAFTYTMLGALRGWADGELDGVRDGRVTAEEAQLYVSSALRSLQITGQQPELVVEGDVVM
ncbi:MAG: hypothetical protein HN348_30885, partial [Proteobacteria bacterium]|nr:hypothetical protein [Pseudomonadota bacterium]